MPAYKKVKLSKNKVALVCPACLKPYKPAKTAENIFGVVPYGFKCAYCGFAGAGPIKLVKK